jgi:hypothetical protein
MLPPLLDFDLQNGDAFIQAEAAHPFNICKNDFRRDRR